MNAMFVMLYRQGLIPCSLQNRINPGSFAEWSEIEIAPLKKCSFRKLLENKSPLIVSSEKPSFIARPSCTLPWMFPLLWPLFLCGVGNASQLIMKGSLATGKKFRQHRD
jgi:hypothetical protein